MVRASWGSPCKLDRAFVDPATGNTSCLWDAPVLGDVEALFEKAGVAVKSITEVEEVVTAE